MWVKWNVHFKKGLSLSASGEDGLTPVQMTMALENQQPDLTEGQGQREI